MFQGNYRLLAISETWFLQLAVALAGVTREFISVRIKQTSSYQQYSGTFRKMLAATARARHQFLFTSTAEVQYRLERLDATGIRLFRRRYEAAMTEPQQNYTRTEASKRHDTEVLCCFVVSNI